MQDRMLVFRATDATSFADEHPRVVIWHELGSGPVSGTQESALLAGVYIGAASSEIHKRNQDAGWWTDLNTGETLKGKHNVGELLCLVHSEISEAMEGHRKGLMDDHLPQRPMIEVELADAVIRILDIAGGLDLDLGGAVAEKLEYNRHRSDHKAEARRQDGGKAY